jgi:hypothetical protein
MIDPAQQRKIFTKSSDFGKSSGKLAQKCLQYVEAELSSHQPTETPAKKLSVRHATDGLRQPANSKSARSWASSVLNGSWVQVVLPVFIRRWTPFRVFELRSRFRTAQYTTESVLSDFRREIRTTAPLEHDNILPIKDASIIEDRLVVVFPLGDETLATRMTRRISVETAFEIGEQILRAAAWHIRTT